MFLLNKVRFLKVKPCVKFAISICICATLFSVKRVVVIGIAVILHELAHMAACKALGIKVFGMKALPWGLTASAPLMHEPLSQFIISAAGPMFNFFLLTFCPAIEVIFSEDTAELFALANLADGLLNLIPALPLDGGIILKAFLCTGAGFVRGFIYMLRITAAIGIFMMMFGLQMLWVTGYNISYLMAGAFILFNLKHERELIMCIKKRLLTGEIRSSRSIKQQWVDSSSHAVCLVNLISPAYTTVFRVTKDGVFIGTVTQERVIDCVLKNTMITVGECIEKF
ncbi:MAG: hypothetical protein J6D26_08740 [Clostridia bacterium]|nr:hypothetical protein [Clostridia bacterium]